MGAKDQSTDQAKTGGVGHEGSDKSFSWERVRRYGEWQTPISENISYGTTTARQIVMDFIVDDGVPQRGHRKNIFSAKYFVTGVSAGNHPVHGSICVVTFAGAFTDGPAGGQTPGAGNSKPAARKF